MGQSEWENKSLSTQASTWGEYDWKSEKGNSRVGGDTEKAKRGSPSLHMR